VATSRKSIGDAMTFAVPYGTIARHDNGNTYGENARVN
jgi:hypothetical protein